jgi:hypothetical protein
MQVVQFFSALCDVGFSKERRGFQLPGSASPKKKSGRILEAFLFWEEVGSHLQHAILISDPAMTPSDNFFLLLTSPVSCSKRASLFTSFLTRT